MDRNFLCELLNEHKKQKECKQGIIISCTGINIQTIKLHEIEKNVETKKKPQQIFSKNK